MPTPDPILGTPPPRRSEIIKGICCCPRCRGPLSWHAETCVCSVCHQAFRRGDGKIYFQSDPGEISREAADNLARLAPCGPAAALINQARRIITSQYQPCRHLARALDRIRPDQIVVECGSGSRRLSENVINMDLHPFGEVDLVGDIRQLPFNDRTVDVIILDTVLEHLDQPQRCVDEARRALKPGGQVICVTPFIFPYHAYPKHYWNFSEDGLRYLFRHFSRVAIETDMGPTSALINLLTEYAALAFQGTAGRRYLLLKGLALVFLFPFKYLDRFWCRSDKARRMAMCLLALAEK